MPGFNSLALSSILKDGYLPLYEDHVTPTSPSHFASCLHSQHKRGYIDIVMDLEKTQWANNLWRGDTLGGAQYKAWRRVRKELERHRNLHVDREKKRAAGKFTFAKLGENE